MKVRNSLLIRYSQIMNKRKKQDSRKRIVEIARRMERELTKQRSA